MRKSRIPTIAVAAVALACASLPAHSTLIASEPVSLNTSDKSAIAVLVCSRTSVKSDSFDAIRILHTKQVYVQVTCEPYGLAEGLPALRVAGCDNTAGRWACNNVSDAVRLRLAENNIVLSHDAHVSVATAVEIAKFAMTVRAFNGYDVAAHIFGRCSIGDGQSVPFQGAVSFNFGCEGWMGTITKDCGGKTCRLFFTSFDEIIA
jgi:hypothetical protein